MIKLPKQMQPIILGENLGVVFHTRSISVVIQWRISREAVSHDFIAMALISIVTTC
jgi:hypothetical protein